MLIFSKLWRKNSDKCVYIWSTWALATSYTLHPGSSRDLSICSSVPSSLCWLSR